MMKVATYNIHYGIGPDGVLDLARIVDAIKPADIVALQEVDRHWDRTGRVDQAAAIGAMMAGHAVAWGPNVDVHKPTAEDPPHGLRRQFGNMILSRFPILSIRNHLLPRYGAAQRLDMQRGALETVIDAPGGPLRVYSTHLCHLSEAQRIVQAHRLLEIHAQCRSEGPVLSGSHAAPPAWAAEPGPSAMPDDAILLGDFNFLPESQAHALLAGDVHPRFGPMARHSGFVDAWQAAETRTPPEDGGTFPAGVIRDRASGADTAHRIDYCFVSPRLADRVADATVVTEAVGSDHQPLIVTLRLP